jgi:SAM-dependent methyltransferase
MSFESSRVLDIGLGRARFLYNVKRLGGIPFGLDLDERAIQYARSLGIDAFRGDIADFVSNTRYDLVTLFDFIEHPLDPGSVLQRSTELLECGGLLAIWTPNGDYSRHRDGYITFRVDLEHMQYLTLEACVFMAARLGCSVVHLETLGFPGIEGIDKPRASTQAFSRRIKDRVKALPGFDAANSVRRMLLRRAADDRLGAYHLFCVMRKYV